MKVYQHGGYRVEVNDDGAIKVRPGDWLSKYSAAIHNDFFHVHEYGRRGPGGAMAPVKNVNLITAGETLYHLPTWRKSQVIRMPEVPITGSTGNGDNLTDAQKKKIIEDHLKQDFNLRGDNLGILSTAIDILGYADNVATLAEIAGLLVEGTVAAGVATGLAVVNAILTPIALMIPVLNATEAGSRIMGMRGVAYATTAWAFNDPRPAPSGQLLSNLRSSPVYTTAEYNNYISAWKASVDATYKNLEAEVVRRKVKRESYQVLLQAAGKRDRATLCLMAMRGFEKQLDTSALRVWKMNYSIEYPR